MSAGSIWNVARLDALGGSDRPALKSGPFGSSLTKNSYVREGYKLYGQQEVLSRNARATDYYVSQEAFLKNRSCAVQSGDILVTLMGTVGRSYVVPDSAESGIINPRLIRLSLDKELVDPYFVDAFLSSPPVQNILNRRAHGGTMPGLNAESLGAITVPLAPVSEQRKIAAILGAWDEAIEKSSRLRDLKLLELDSLRRELLGANGASKARWELKPLGQISTRVRRRSDQGDHPVMTIASKSGFVLQSDKYSREMAGTSLATYVMLRENEFAYNKGNSLTFPQGCVFALDRQVALVPHVYFCFALVPALHHDFYRHVFDAGLLNHQLAQRINSGVRNNGLLNINAHEFFECKLPVPTHGEQVKIANVLTSAKAEIALLDRSIIALKQQKRGLTQKLLTGQWRVNVGDTV